MSTYASTKNVKYRPGRIQLLTPDQEIALKQTYAYLLKYWGYRLLIPDEDVAFAECFIASSILAPAATNALARTSTRNSVVSASTSRKTGATGATKRLGLFGRGKPAPPVGPSPNSRRMKQIQTQSSQDRYVPVDQASEDVRYVYSHHYKQAFEHQDDYESDDSDYDTDADSFITALTLLTDPELHFAPPEPVKKSNGFAKGPNGTSNGASHRAHVSVKPNLTISSHLAKYKPADLHHEFFSTANVDLVDNYVLRFVRARKWVPENAVAMLSNSLNWRHNEYPATQWVREGDSVSFLNGTNKGLIKNFTTSKSYIRGVDRNGNPIFMFIARKHFASDSPLADTQRFSVLTIEWCRLFMREINESVDCCSVIFDLTGFSLKNADNHAIKFLAEVFEAHYPECLGSILIHNAPWIFSTIWNIIKNWFDPVVAAKIHFTKDIGELSNFVELKHIPDYLGGDDQYDGEYLEPEDWELTPPKRKDAAYRRLRVERDELLMSFMEATIRWVESINPETSSKYLEDKINLEYRLSDNYLKLDPYVRNSGVYDRLGTLKIRN